MFSMGTLVNRVDRLVSVIEALEPEERRSRPLSADELKKLRRVLDGFLHGFRDGRVRLHGEDGLVLVGHAGPDELLETADKLRRVLAEFAPRFNKKFDGRPDPEPPRGSPRRAKFAPLYDPKVFPWTDGKEELTDAEAGPGFAIEMLAFTVERGALVLTAQQLSDIAPLLFAYTLAGDEVRVGRCDAPQAWAKHLRCDRAFVVGNGKGRPREVCSDSCRLLRNREKEGARSDERREAQRTKERREIRVGRKRRY